MSLLPVRQASYRHPRVALNNPSVRSLVAVRRFDGSEVDRVWPPLLAKSGKVHRPRSRPQSGATLFGLPLARCILLPHRGNSPRAAVGGLTTTMLVRRGVPKSVMISPVRSGQVSDLPSAICRERSYTQAVGTGYPRGTWTGRVASRSGLLLGPRLLQITQK